MEPLTLHLSVQELRLVLQALGTQPYANVHQFIDNLQQQAAPQLQSIKEAQQEAEETVKESGKIKKTA